MKNHVICKCDIHDVKQQENIIVEGFDHEKSSNILLGQLKDEKQHWIEM